MITQYTYISNDHIDKPRTQGILLRDDACDLFKDPTRNARQVKVLSHLYVQDEWSLWTDGTIELLKPLEEIFEKYKNRGEVVFFKHRARNSCYTEAAALIDGGRDDHVDLIKEQIETYYRDGYPLNNGLFETGVILRHHTPKVIEFNNFWWSQISRFCRRDQVSVNYSAWKTGIEYGFFDGDLNHSEDFYIYGHGV